MKITPAKKGLITAICMIMLFLILLKLNKRPDSRLQFLVYTIYGTGIIWTLVVYRNSASFTGKFMDSFSQGFKCFVVVTLCMALFYGILNYLHPEFAHEAAAFYKEQLLKENKLLHSEMEAAVSTFRKQYTLKLVSAAIFGYLMTGAIITSVISMFLIRRK